MKIIYSQNTAKKLSPFTNFPANIFQKKKKTFRKKHLHCTLSWLPRTTFLKNFESKWLYISVYLCFKDVVRFYLVVWRMGRGWKNFLGGLLFGPCKMFYDFSFQLKFLEIQLFFSVLIIWSIALKRWNWTSKERLWLNFSWEVTFSQYKIIRQ